MVAEYKQRIDKHVTSLESAEDRCANLAVTLFSLYSLLFSL